MTRYRSLALELRLRCPSDDALSARLAELYRACETFGNGVVDLDLELVVDNEDASLYVLRSGDDVICHTHDADELIEWFAWRVNRSAVERTAPDLLLIHGAGACAGTHGVLVTGPSGAGKSTLVTALTLAGLAYMGEESLGVTADGFVIANPKPIALDVASRTALAAFSPATTELAHDRRLFAPDAIGPVVGREARVQPALIVRPCFRSGAEARATPMAPAEAAVLLADQSFNFATMGGDGLRTVAGVARTAPAYTLEFDDLAAAVPVVLGLLRDARPSARTVDADRDDTDRTHGDVAIVMLDGEAVIWDPAREALHHLSASATAIWDAVCSGASPSAITDTVTNETNRARAEVSAEVGRCIADLEARNLLP